NGYGLMAGGALEHVDRAMPLFDALRPAGPREEGFVHAGGVGAGHYAKMVHNGIEYGLMQAYAEGFELLGASGVVTDVPGTLKAWSRGTVVRSWLLDLLVEALEADPELASIDDWVADSGEGRWTVDEAIDHAVPLPVISAALFARFASRQDDSPAMKAVAALRHQFGGHARARSRSGSPRGVRTGPGSPGEPSSGCAPFSGWCGRCSSPPRTLRSSRATRTGGGASSTSSPSWCARAWRAPCRTTTACSSSAQPCSRVPRPPSRVRVGTPTCARSTCGTRSSRRSARRSSRCATSSSRRSPRTSRARMSRSARGRAR